MKIESRKKSRRAVGKAASAPWPDSVRIVEGRPEGKGLRIAIVVSRFNEDVTDHLLRGALAALGECGTEDDGIEVIRVPGAFEIPIAVKKAAQTGRFDGVIALGAVIRGETPHFEYISDAVTRGISRIALESGTPVGFGVLTTETVRQAMDRASPAKHNRGAQTAMAVLEMANLVKEIR